MLSEIFLKNRLTRLVAAKEKFLEEQEGFGRAYNKLCLHFLLFLLFLKHKKMRVAFRDSKFPVNRVNSVQYSEKKKWGT